MTTDPHVNAPTSYHTSPRRAQKHCVLLVGHADGWLELFGDREHIDAHIEMMPAASTRAAEILAEKQLELSVPRRHREIYYPSNRRAADMLRRVTPEDIAWRNWELDLLHAIQGLDTINRDKRATEGRRLWIS